MTNFRNKGVDRRATFQRGTVTMNIGEEERLFILALVKKADMKTDLDKRILKRLVTRCMGYSVANLKLYPSQECPICENSVAGNRFVAHVAGCKEKERLKKVLPKIDPVVWEMMG